MCKLLLAVTVSVMVAVSQPQPASLDGRVTDASGQPIPKAGLTLTSQSGAQSRHVYRTTSAVDGAFSFPAVEPGTYNLAAERSGYQRSSYRAGVHETFSAIQLTAGKHASIDLRMVRSATISGRVLDADGDPVRSAQVRLLRRAFQPGFALTSLGGLTMTDQSGRYAIPDVAPGVYYLCAGVAGFEGAFLVFGLSAFWEPPSLPAGSSNVQGTYYASTFYPGVVDQTSAKAIRVQRADLTNLDISLVRTRAFRVGGTLTGVAPGHPLDQYRVTLARIGAPLSMGPSFQGTAVQIAKDGTFDFGGARFPPGEYNLAVAPSGGRPSLALARQPLTIVDHDIQNSVLALQPLLQLHGKFVVEGEPQTDFSVLPGSPPPTVTTHLSLSVEGESTWGATSSNITSDGSFTIGDVAPGKYEVHISGNPGGTWVKSIRVGTREAAANVIDVTASSAAEPIQVLLSRSMGIIEGTVRTKSAAHAPGSTVIILSIPLGGSSSLTGTDANGDFTMPLAPGQYRLYAWEDLMEAQRYDPSFLQDHERESVIVNLKEAGRERVTLTVIPSGSEAQ